MSEKNVQPQQETQEIKTSAKKFWKHFGFVCFAIGLALLTVLIVNI